MAVIGKIRSYSGLLIAIIGLGLAAFVLQDFFGSGTTQQRGVSEVGKVENNKISPMEFFERVSTKKRHTGLENVEPQIDFVIRNYTWERIVAELLINEEIDNIGLRISSEEYSDIFFGDEPHDMVMQFFGNPQTGELDKEMVFRILEQVNCNIDRRHMNQQEREVCWLKQELRKQKRQEKYLNLVRNGYYAPKTLAELSFQQENVTADLRYVMKNYNDIATDQIRIYFPDLINSYHKIKHEYKNDEETRDIEYVVFPVFPSDEDREEVYNSVLELTEELKTTRNEFVESFVNSVSDIRFDPTFKTEGSLNIEIDSIMFNSPVGTVVGPYREGNYFKSSRLHSIELRPDSMSAKHILVAYQGALQADPSIERPYAQAKEKADSLLDIFNRGRAQIEDLAPELSDDPTAAFNQGDLGWFEDGQMTKNFNRAIIDNSIGDFVVAETEYGFHIIEITGKSAPKKNIQVAHVAREIAPSSATYNKVYTEASSFSAKAQQTDDFERLANEKDLVKRSAQGVTIMSNNLPGVNNPRAVIRWAFMDNVKVGDVSSIEEIDIIDDYYIVAHLANITPKGYPPLAEIEDRVREHALNQKKYELFSQKIKETEYHSIYDMAEKLGLNVQYATNMKYKASMLSGAGYEPFVIGKAISNETDVISEPIKGNAGVFVVKITRKDDPFTPSSLTPYQERLRANFTRYIDRDTDNIIKYEKFLEVLLRRNFAANIQSKVIEALRENASIEDNRAFDY